MHRITINTIARVQYNRSVPRRITSGLDMSSRSTMNTIVFDFVDGLRVAVVVLEVVVVIVVVVEGVVVEVVTVLVVGILFKVLLAVVVVVVVDIVVLGLDDVVNSIGCTVWSVVLVLVTLTGALKRYTPRYCKEDLLFYPMPDNYRLSLGEHHQWQYRLSGLDLPLPQIQFESPLPTPRC
uniref:Uncharacterized protein n=1 Tax=Glossina austeni TaxID=7395 RepID=A0A1A9UGR7_GLOAU